MTVPAQYELQPAPGTPASQRKAQLDAARFVAVRNLAHLIYKKPDGTSLMTYQETLDDREKVKNTIVQHEINLGLLVADNGGAPQQPAPIASPQQAAAPVVSPIPQQVPVNQPVPQMMAPQYAPQMQPPAPQMVPAVAAPAQAAAPGPMPQDQAAPPAAPAGRKRRGAGAGVAVPAPVAAAPMNPAVQQTAPQMVPQQAAPQMVAPGFTPPTGPATPGPVAFTGAPVQAAPVFSTPAPAPAAAPAQAVPVAVDLSPVLARLDAIGGGIEALVKQNEALATQVGHLQNVNKLALAALHHLYATSPALGASVQNTTLDQFVQHLAKFAGNPS